MSPTSPAGTTGHSPEATQPSQAREAPTASSFADTLARYRSTAPPQPETPSATTDGASPLAEQAGDSPKVPLAPPEVGPLPCLPCPAARDPLVPAHQPRRPRADPLDPAVRQAAQWAPPTAPVASGPMTSAPTATDAVARTSLEQLVPELVRKIAWSGDGRRGSMRLEIGAGAMAGVAVVVHADGGRVRVHLDAPRGTDVGEWRARISERLTQRGIELDAIESG